VTVAVIANGAFQTTTALSGDVIAIGLGNVLALRLTVAALLPAAAGLPLLAAAFFLFLLLGADSG
jgi:hypothetical protein